jgi:oxygen-independent coproporphyrinogen-3 oxidase
MELYIHIPFCIRKCNYCDFVSGVSTDAERKSYTKALERELNFYAKRFKDVEVTSVFIGGGTPTFLE